VRRRKRQNEERVDDRTWSARSNFGATDRNYGIARGDALPAETGPIRAPDELSVWPVEGGRYGIDAHYHGPTGERRAEHQRSRLAAMNLTASVREREAESGGATLRLGPLQHQAAWIALEAFLGKPLPQEHP
jgi:hypothetical protein